MSERYSRVYVLPQAVYTANTPVIISAGALLEDHVNKNILAQLKFTNICSKHVKAVKVRITCLDAFGVPLGDPLAFQYLELNAGMGESFGQKTPIPVPNPTTRIIQPEITGIIFADNSTQSFGDDTWMPIPTLKSLQSTLGDTLAEQYRCDVSDGAKYEPITLQGLWICTCGTVNQTGEHYCYSCRTEKAKQFLGLDRDTLRKNRESAEAAAEIARKDTILAEGKAKMVAHKITDYESAIQLFQSIPGWKDANDQIEICFASIEKIRTDAEIARKDAIYNKTKSVISKQVVNISEYQSAIAAFNTIRGWKDADTQIIICQQKIEELKAKAEADRIERERQAERKRAAELAAEKKRKKRNTILSIVAVCVVLVCVSVYIWINVIIPNNQYNDACSLMEQGQYEDAIALFNDLAGYKDSAEQIIACENGILENKYNAGLALLKDGKYEEAYAAFEALGEYSDSVEQCKESRYQIALIHWNNQEYDVSNVIFKELGNYKDSTQKIHAHNYTAEVLIEPGCEAEGEERLTCQNCPNSYTQPIQATGHSYGESQIILPASCTDDGEEETVCTACGDSYIEIIQATGHNYDGGIVTTVATCEADGIKTFSCQCGDNYTEKIGAIGHNYSKVTCTSASVCANCSHEKQAALGHEANATKRCVRCDVNLTERFEYVSDSIYYDRCELDYQPAPGKYRITVTVLSVKNLGEREYPKIEVQVGYLTKIDEHNVNVVKVGAVFTAEFWIDKSDWGTNVLTGEFELLKSITIQTEKCTVKLVIEPLD